MLVPINLVRYTERTAQLSEKERSKMSGCEFQLCNLLAKESCQTGLFNYKIGKNNGT